jgi:predicted metal-binding membrane protein
LGRRVLGDEQLRYGLRVRGLKTASTKATARDVPLRQILPWWIALCLLAALAWAVTVIQARGMGVGPGTMGLSLAAFLALWVVMMTAMMFPSVAPMVVVWIRSVSARPTRGARVTGVAEFLCGYLVAWAAFGLLAYGVLIVADRLVEASPAPAKWVGAGIFLLAGVYQLTPLKRACLRHCRSPIGSLFHYASFKGPARDLRVGMHHGFYCVGCCWGLMVVLVAVGVMNIGVMAALAAVILIEKIWRYGRPFAVAVGITLIVLAALALSMPSLLPGLRGTTPMSAQMPAQTPTV